MDKYESGELDVDDADAIAVCGLTMFYLDWFICVISKGSTLTKYDDYRERELSAYERTSHSSNMKALE